MEKLSEVLDKNIDRLVEAIGKLGPDAQFVFQDMVERQALSASLGAAAWFVFALAALALGGCCLMTGLRENYSIYNMKKEGSVLIGAVLLITGFIFTGAFVSDFASALHPTATVVKDLIQ